MDLRFHQDRSRTRKAAVAQRTFVPMNAHDGHQLPRQPGSDGCFPGTRAEAMATGIAQGMVVVYCIE